MKQQMIVRLDYETKQKLNQLAQQEGKSTSQVVRDLIVGYIRDRDLGAHIDDLWDRVEKRFEEENVTSEKIDRALREARKARR